MSPTNEPSSRRTSQTGYALRSVRRALVGGLGNARRLLGQLAARLWTFIRPVIDVVGPAGWLALGGAALALILGGALGWMELSFIGVTLVAAFVIAVAFVFGRSSFAVLIELNPHRVVAGQRALGRMLVRNTAERNALPVRMELPVGDGLAEFLIPSLPPGGEQEELFAVPTERRAVIVAGPAVSVRGDQLGLLRRAVRWTEPVELFVHPVTTRLASSAAGLVRDLEGEVTKTITDNDISFHALRAYQPGDALRNVHWRTTARTGQLMVRQFEETRRTQLTVVHTTERDHYADEEEFELAISVTASLALQVIRDGTRLNVVTEERPLRTSTPTTLLDDSSRLLGVEGAYPSLRDFARDTTKRLSPPSVAMIVAGSTLPLAELRSVTTLFGLDTMTIAFRVECGASSRVGAVSGITVLTVGTLDDLPKLLRRVHR
ncbi:DUF58 domain-containing protein [Luethyella okanaganae]|uniref:DUF58 domain-containing protein n=1 Tax=Luethyella okanaganae TaxID=69372 RepID=A0ABW1VEV6_9MICO